jgi:hypothetical protein
VLDGRRNMLNGRRNMLDGRRNMISKKLRYDIISIEFCGFCTLLPLAAWTP